MPYVVIIIKPDGSVTSSEQKSSPDLEQVNKAVEGHIEQVLHFTRYGDHRRGIAFVNEEGRYTKPFNAKATQAWLENLGKGPFRYPIELFGNMIYYAKIK
jgi:hypothetical protein